jgi:hypothetical protein
MRATGKVSPAFVDLEMFFDPLPLPAVPTNREQDRKIYQQIFLDEVSV